MATSTASSTDTAATQPIDGSTVQNSDGHSAYGSSDAISTLSDVVNTEQSSTDYSSSSSDESTAASSKAITPTSKVSEEKEDGIPLCLACVPFIALGVCVLISICYK